VGGEQGDAPHESAVVAGGSDHFARISHDVHNFGGAEIAKRSGQLKGRANKQDVNTTGETLERPASLKVVGLGAKNGFEWRQSGDPIARQPNLMIHFFGLKRWHYREAELCAGQRLTKSIDQSSDGVIAE